MNTLSPQPATGSMRNRRRKRRGRKVVFFRILGPIEIEYAHTIVTPKAPKLRQVAALLILHANRTASATQLIEELWQEQPPASALTTLQTYIYQLRKIFGAVVPPGDARDLLTTRPS